MRLRSFCIRIRRVLSEPQVTVIFVMGCDYTAPAPGIPCVRFAPRPLTLREGDVCPLCPSDISPASGGNRTVRE